MGIEGLSFATRQNGSVSGRGIERDLEIGRLERELRESRRREEVARAEVRQVQERFEQLRLTSRNFATSMRESSAERRRSRQRIAAQYAVGRVLAEASEFEEAAPNVLRILVEGLGWTLGTFWSLEGNVLRCHDLRPRAGGEGAFEKACRGLSLRRGEGLPGRAWAAGRPVWVEDVLADGGFLRGSAAEESGLRSAVAIPACDGGRTSGVFELFREEVTPPDEELLRVASVIGGQIGQFAERRRAEREREWLLRREREAHAEAEAARGRTVDVLESMGDAFLSYDRDWRLTYVNAAAAELLRRIGQDPEALRGKVVWEEVPELAGTKFDTEVRRALREGAIVEYEEYLPALDVWLGASVYPSEGGVSTYIRDITERRKVREALENNEKRWRALIERGSDVITISDRDGTIRFASPSIEAVCGYSMDEFVGSDPLRDGHVYPEDVERCEEAFRELEDRPGHSVTVQHRYRHKSGGWRWLEGTFSSLFHDPTIGGLVANFRDVTERREAEEAVRVAAERARFRVELADALRPLTDPVEVQATASRVLGEHLGADRAYYVEIDGANGEFAVARDWHRPGAPSHAGRYPLGDWPMPWLADGETWVVRDVDSDPAMPDDQRESYRGNDVGAAVVVPLVKEDRLVATLVANARTPRPWTPQEVALIAETAERTWAAVERARAEEALRESEERMRLAAEGAQLYAWDADLVAGRARFSEHAAAVYGYDELPESWHDLATAFEAIHPDDRENVRAAMMGAVHGGGRYAATYRTRTASGGYLWMEARGIVERDGEGHAGRMRGIVLNVDARTRAEEALREYEEWLRIAQRAARSGTWEWNLRSGEIRWSGEHRALFGFDPSDEPIELGDWWDVIHPDDLPSVEEAGRRCFEDGDEWPEIEYRIFRGGEVRWIDARGSTEKDANGRPVRILGISTDVTERKEAEELRDRLLAREWVARAEVAERERISRELHDRVAHSMAVVHQSLQLHEVFKESNAPQAAAKMAMARTMAKTALESTRNLSMELRRSEAEEGLVPALQDLLKVAVPPGIRADLRAEGDESRVPPHVRGQLFSILREGVRNAVKHSGAGHVRVGLEISPAEASCSVEDDGRGLPTENGENADGAAGVGLRSMRERAGLLGGDFRLSSGPGEGTKVEVTVPLNGGR